MTRPIYIIGHKHSDMDSVASAYAYARLLQLQGGKHVTPARSGELRPEVDFVFKRFHIEPPQVLSDLYLQVRDVMESNVVAIHTSQSLLEATQLLQKHSYRSLPVIDAHKQVQGVITQEDVAKQFSQQLTEEFDSSVDHFAPLQRENVVRVLKGPVLLEGQRELGKRILVAAMESQTLRTALEPGDLVVTGDLQSAQATALEHGASALVVTDGAAVTERILALAREHGAMVISTTYRTFTALRLLSMSVSAQAMMKRQFPFCHPEDYLDDIRPELLQNNALPVVDSKRRLVGYLSRTDLLNARPKQVYLVDHNERSQAVDGIEEAELLGIIDHHRVADISTSRPILFRVEPVGSTSTIIATFYQEENIPLPPPVAGILLGGILSDTLVLRSPTCTPRDKRIATELAALAGEDVEQFGQEIFAVATSILSNQPAEQLLTADFKEFVIEASRFAIGTIETVNTATLEKRIPELLSTMERIAQEHRYASFMFMIVNILQMRCHLLIWGGERAVAQVLGVPLETNGHTAVVDGLVSRKKQLVPLLPRIHEAMEALPHRRG